jgi:hypothetical protein
MATQKCWEPKLVQKSKKCECTNVQFSFADGTPPEYKGGTLYVNDGVGHAVGTFVYQNTIDNTNEVCLSLGKTYNYTYVQCTGRPRVYYVYQSKITTSPNACKQQIKLIPTLCNAVEICDLNNVLSENYGKYLETYYLLERFVNSCLQQEI